MTAHSHPQPRGRLRFAARSRQESVDRVLSSVFKAKEAGRQWKKSYQTTVFVVDALAVVSAVAFAQVVRFGMPEPHSEAYVNVTLFSIALAVLWMAALGLQQSWDLTLVGVGAEEYRRVMTATGWVFGGLAALGLLLQEQMARGYLVIALPVGLIGLIVGRHLMRRHLARKRSAGEFTTQVVVMGKPDSIVELCTHLNRSKSSGYKVIGACVPSFESGLGLELETPCGPVPILGDENSIEDALRLTNADAVAVTAVERLGRERIRKLAWHLDSLRIDMIVVPGMTDVAGPRLRVRPIDGLPLFNIARPRHDGPSRYGKRVFDLTFGTIAAICVTPLMLAAAIAIKLDDGGPVFFRQQRVGLHGRPFHILKFRTMNVDADRHKQDEKQTSGTDSGVFFKSACDSRITPVGSLLRRTSVDELPQVFNVLSGAMSLVGPRPLVPGEGSSVEHFTERRALVKPGMTGLWQVSGRSDVSEDERIRLDHSYVDNWSFVQDLVIIWRTVRTVLKREGAY